MLEGTLPPLHARAARGVWLGATALALCLPRLAAGAELYVEGPAGCVDRDELVFRIEQALRKPLGDAVPLTLNVRIEREGSGLSGRVEVSADSARPLRRVMTAPTCDDLADALTVVSALALNSAEQDDRRAEAEEPLPAPVSAPRQVAAAAAASIDTVPDDGNAGSNELSLEAPGIAAGISVGVVGDAGSLPEAALGVAFGVELGTQRWRLRALGTLLLDQHHQVGSSGPAPGAELGLATAALSACALSASSLPPLEVLGCAGWELGQLSGVGTGVPDPRRGTKLWSAPLLGAGARWHVPETAFRLGATVDLAAPLGRDEFVLRGVGRVHRPASIVGRVVLGAELTLD